MLPSRKTKSRWSGRNFNPSGNSAGGPSLTVVGASYETFGTSERSGAFAIQRGLIEQKEGFGARVVPQDVYEIELSGWEPGKLLGALT